MRKKRAQTLGEWLAARVGSVRCAAAGVWHVVRKEPNAREHLVASALVIAVGTMCRLGAGEWLWLMAAMAVVWIAEAFNTALELLADAAVPGEHPLVGRAKDVAAGAVLLGAVTAAGIGAWVLVPHLVAMGEMWRGAGARVGP